MSTTLQNVFSYSSNLHEPDVATAAALEMITAACGASEANASATNATQKITILNWAVEGDNLKNLRDKIMECTSTED